MHSCIDRDADVQQLTYDRTGTNMLPLQRRAELARAKRCLHKKLRGSEIRLYYGVSMAEITLPTGIRKGKGVDPVVSVYSK